MITPGEEFKLDGNDMEPLLTEVRFEQLLNIAKDVCFTGGSLEFKSRYTPNDRNAKVVQAGGVLALRAALELSSGRESWDGFSNLDEYDTDKHITLDTPLRDPSLFHDRTNPEIVAQIEMFGKQLIDESYAVLGPEADKYVQVFQSGNLQEQIKSVIWLDKRLKELTKGVGPSNLQEVEQYYPFRLSPKVLQNFPGEVTPTCLGVSILAASFFERAGADYLHAGVATSSREMQMEGMIDLLEYLEQQSQYFPTDFYESAEKKKLEIAGRLYLDRGFHAALYVRCANDRWLQVDPNYQSTRFVNPVVIKKLDETHSMLKEFEPVAPNLELGQPMPILASFQTGTRYLVEHYHNNLPEDLLESALTTIMCEGESVPQKIYDDFIKMTFERFAQDETLHAAVRYVAEDLTTCKILSGETDRDEEYLQEVFYKIFEKYFMRGRSFDEIRMKCMKDDGYLGRTIDDILCLPIMTCVALGLDDMHENVLDVREHQNLELGLPYSRIGASVLSDFAVYYDDSLPPSFWPAHWPSLIPMTESMHRSGNRKAQNGALRNQVVWNRQRYLTYTESRVINEEYLQVNPE